MCEFRRIFELRFVAAQVELRILPSFEFSETRSSLEGRRLRKQKTPSPIKSITRGLEATLTLAAIPLAALLSLVPSSVVSDISVISNVRYFNHIRYFRSFQTRLSAWNSAVESPNDAVWAEVPTLS
jgi:hypothetical protein